MSALVYIGGFIYRLVFRGRVMSHYKVKIQAASENIQLS